MLETILGIFATIICVIGQTTLSFFVFIFWIFALLKLMEKLNLCVLKIDFRDKNAEKEPEEDTI